MRQMSPPAFPETKYAGNSDRRPVDEAPGMSLRDWFAGQALAGMIGANGPGDTPWAQDPHTLVAATAYALADAMIAERSK